MMQHIQQFIRTYSAIFLQLIRFVIVGCTAAVVHFCVVVLLVQNNLLAPLSANVFAFMISFQTSYFGHRYFTFSDTVVSHRAGMSRLLLIQTINFIANETLFYIFLSYGLSYPVALLIVLTILPIFTFISSKIWVFGKVQDV